MDAHYNQLHKKYETFEKRQRRREKERLQHERYKMKERVDLIRGMDGKRYVEQVFSHAKERMNERTSERLDEYSNCELTRSVCSGFERENSFAALVASGDPPLADGKVRKVVQPEEIRSKMLEEAEEVLRRYDQLLPVENRMYVFLSFLFLVPYIIAFSDVRFD